MTLNRLISRRHVLRTGAAFTAISALSPARVAMAGPTEDPFLLRAAAGQAALRPAPYGSTDVWSYNGSLPGPEIRVRQGDRIRVLAQNGLNGDDIPEDQRPECLPEHARPGRECFENLVHSTKPFSLCCLICKPVGKTSLRGAKTARAFQPIR